ncbi:hypothetical protein M2322_003896 [Rhodoblastus acidophilus]|nr:hypothetical protein [Rhodoblastus acidophilus]
MPRMAALAVSRMGRARCRVASVTAVIAYQTPAANAANLPATCDRLRNPDQLRRSHVAPTAPQGVKPAEALIAAG